MTSISCIDLSPVASKSALIDDTNEEEWKKVGIEVVECFESIGFIYIKNHGISQDLISKVHEVTKAFFSLPKEDKMRYAKPNNEDRQGYVEPNREAFHIPSAIRELRESYDVMKPDGMFPLVVKDFKETVNEIIKEGIKLSYKLLKCIEIALNIPRGTLINAHRYPFTSVNGSVMRMLNYPPVPDDVTEGTLRCGIHSDYSTLSLLFQDNMGGLEVKNREGEWIHADPIPNTILINVGDFLEMWTGGRFMATKHRVRVPEAEIKRRCTRNSFVFFLLPEDEVLVEPLVGSTEYPPVIAEEYKLKRFNETFRY